MALKGYLWPTFWRLDAAGQAGAKLCAPVATGSKQTETLDPRPHTHEA